MTGRRTIAGVVAVIALAILIVTLVSPAGARRGGAGHNGPTRKLEAAFKVALDARSSSLDGCYPSPKRLVKMLRKERFRAGVGGGPGSARVNDVVYVLRSGKSCGRVLMALRSSSGLYVLDSESGNIRVRGHGGFRRTPGRPGPARGLVFRQKTIRLSKGEQQSRGEVFCPGKTYPIGGGVINPGPPPVLGEGLFPHSYERLGAQRGWHVSFILFDSDKRAGTTPRSATIQVPCARNLVPANPSPHATVFIKQNETGTATARCPQGQYLIMGGFQRTDFGADGGNYVTESRADGPSAWRVSGAAFPLGGGELTAIAYCVRRSGPILTEVSAEGSAESGQTGAVTTPQCPAGQVLTSTGFSENDSHAGFFVNSSLNPDNTSTSQVFGAFGAVPKLTAYGYCMTVL